jgi:hypothetical protein
MKTIAFVVSICVAWTASTACVAAQENPDWKIRAGFVGVSNDFSMLDEMARCGMNSVVVSYGGHLVDFKSPGRAKLQKTLGAKHRQTLRVRYSNDLASVSMR